MARLASARRARAGQAVVGRVIGADMLLRYTAAAWGPWDTNFDKTCFCVVTVVELMRSPSAIMARQPARCWWIQFPMGWL